MSEDIGDLAIRRAAIAHLERIAGPERVASSEQLEPIRDFVGEA